MGQKNKTRATYTAKTDAGNVATFTATGRVHWALCKLIEAGPKGCTPIAQPAPRWSHYIHCLRGLGVEIETIREPHEGPYPGTHGRYVLRSTVTREGAAQ